MYSGLGPMSRCVPRVLGLARVAYAPGGTPPIGLLRFEFSRFWPADYEHGRDFIADLDKFLGQLPNGWPYGVEMRNRSWLKPEYLQAGKNAKLLPLLPTFNWRFSAFDAARVLIRFPWHGN